MDYEAMEKDEKKPYKQLYNYYKSIEVFGFRSCDLIFLTLDHYHDIIATANFHF